MIRTCKGISPFGLLEQNYCRLGDLETTESSHSSGAGKSKIKALTDLESGEDVPPGSQSAISLCPHWVGGMTELLWSLL